MSDFIVFHELENGGYGVANERFVAEYNAEGEMTECIGAKDEAPRKIVVHKRKNEKKDSEITMSVAIDTGDVNKLIELIDERIHNSDAFKVLNGEMFIKPAPIQDAKIGNAIESARPVANTYNINMGKLSGNESYQNTVTFTVDKFRIHSGVNLNVESIMENALANHEEAEQLSDTVRDIAREVIRNEMKPNGLLSSLKR